MLLKALLTILFINSSLGESERFLNFRSNPGRIVNGEVIDIEDVPYYVAVLERGIQSCGGSIIAAKWILTAAHCVVII